VQPASIHASELSAYHLLTTGFVVSDVDVDVAIRVE